MPILNSTPCSFSSEFDLTFTPEKALTKKQKRKVMKLEKALHGLEMVARFMSPDLYKFKREQILDKFK